MEDRNQRKWGEWAEIPPCTCQSQEDWIIHSPLQNQGPRELESGGLSSDSCPATFSGEWHHTITILSICMKRSAKAASSPQHRDPSNHPLLSGNFRCLLCPLLFYLGENIETQLPHLWNHNTALCAWQGWKPMRSCVDERAPWIERAHWMWFCRPLLCSGGTATTLLNFSEPATESTWTGMEWMTLANQ